jgi:nucleotide-binding universal stress UspA family protein
MVPVTTNETAVTMIPMEEIKDSADEGLKRLQQSVQQSYPDVAVRIESRLGDVVNELEDVCRQYQPYAVVMGRHHLSGMEQALFGSSTLSAIRHIDCPIIAVAAGTAFELPKNIVLATDLADIEKFPAQKIIRLLQPFNAAVHIVHIADEETPIEEAQKGTLLTTPLAALRPNFEIIQHSDIAQGLQQYIEQHHAEWLILIPHEYNLLQRVFSKQHIKSILDHISIPAVSVAE